MAEKKLKYKEVPQALGYVVRTIWKMSPSFVVLTVIQELKNRLVPFATLFIAAAVTSRLPALIEDSGQFDDVLSLVAIGAAIELASRFVDFLIQAPLAFKGHMVTITMREHFYGKYAALPYHLYEDKSVIDAFNYADEFMYRFSQFGLMQITRTVGSMLEFVLAVVALVAVAWYLPIALIVFMPLLLRSIMRINRMQAQVHKENLPQNRRIWTIETFFYPERIKETRLYGVVEHFLRRRRDLSTRIKQREINIEAKQNKMQLSQYSLSQGLVLLASGVALWRIAFRGAPLGTFVLAQSLTTRAGSAVEMLFNEVSRFDSDLYGFAEYRFITETLQEPPRTKHELPAEAQPGLELRNVSFVYPETDKEVLSNVNLQIHYGSSIAIVGENGAGKTTLIRLLLGLYRPASGEIMLNGQPLHEYDMANWHRHVGVLLQDFGMIHNLTVRESIRIGDISKPDDDALVWQSLEQAELKDTIEALPHKLDTYLSKWIDEEKGTELSGGQEQRLAIARALYRNPSILVLDEPTSAVDAHAEERIFEKLVSSREGKTTIFISHRFSTVRRAEHIIFMEDGRVAESGTHEELMKLKGKYHQMFMAQAKGYQ